MRSFRRGGLAALAIALVVAGCSQSVLRPTLTAKWLEWPPNEGCAGPEQHETLAPGTGIDRYGSENGSYFSSPGTSYAARSLPYNAARIGYTVYVVLKPLQVDACRIAPWFDEPGGGMQFKTSETAAQLRAEQVIAPR